MGRWVYACETAGQVVVCQLLLCPVDCCLQQVVLLPLSQCRHEWFQVVLALTCCSSLLAWWLALEARAVIKHDFLKGWGGDNHVEFAIARYILKRERYRVSGINEQGGGRVDFRCFRMAFLGLNNFDVSMQVERNKVTHPSEVSHIGIDLKNMRVLIDEIILLLLYPSTEHGQDDPTDKHRQHKYAHNSKPMHTCWLWRWLLVFSWRRFMVNNDALVTLLDYLLTFCSGIADGAT